MRAYPPPGDSRAGADGAAVPSQRLRREAPARHRFSPGPRYHLRALRVARRRGGCHHGRVRSHRRAQPVQQPSPRQRRRASLLLRAERDERMPRRRRRVLLRRPGHARGGQARKHLTLRGHPGIPRLAHRALHRDATRSRERVQGHPPRGQTRAAG